MKQKPTDTLHISGKYTLQHYQSDYKPFYYGEMDSHGMNSCASAVSPIADTLDAKIDNDTFDTDCTYIIAYDVTVTVHKMTKKEEKIWMRRTLPGE